MTQSTVSSSFSRQALSRGETNLLLVWMLLAIVGFWRADPPPEMPRQNSEEEAVRQRLAQWAQRDARQWQKEHGDLRIPWSEASGHLAIVIDDVGRELRIQERLLALRIPLTFSILPGSAYSFGSQLRLRADHRRYREVWLHLPMEPVNHLAMNQGHETEEDFILASDPPDIVLAKLDAALARVPVAIGVNNHMGSLATTEESTVAVLMAELQRRGLAFLDSRTSPDTLAAASACVAGVPTASRKIFLDHDPQPNSVLKALEEATRIAQNAPTIVIAHPIESVVDVLESKISELQRAKIGVFPLSELMSHLDRSQVCATWVQEGVDPAVGRSNH